MSDLSAARRERIIALLRTRDDWVSVPGARPLGGEGEILSDRERVREEPWEQRARERRYRDRVDREIATQSGDDGPTRNEAAYRAHMASGSYKELADALDEMKKRKPYSWWLLDRLYVQGIPTQIQDYRLDSALRELSDRLPDLLRVPVMQLEEPETREERDRRIAAYAAAGKSTRWIAARVGLTQPRVVQILARQRKLAPAA